jgi:hypothetical protein
VCFMRVMWAQILSSYPCLEATIYVRLASMR